MADETLTTLRAQLTDERTRLRDQLRQMGHLGEKDLDYDEGFADVSAVTAERGEVEALAATLEETLTEIEDALAKFDAGTYGACENCGKQISEARLEAMPMARHCIECARLADD